MKPTPERRFVDDIAAALFAPLLRPSSGPWKLVGWDAEQGLTLTLDLDGKLLLIELEARDEARACYAQTSRFNVCVRPQFEATETLSDGDRRLVDAVVAMVRQREHVLPDPPRTITTRRAMLREILVERVLISEGAGHYYVNPYAGCMIGCAFCYVAPRADFSRSLEGLPKLPWGAWLDVKVNAPDILRDEVRTAPPGVVRMSPILTDPYQPAERRYRITRRCLEVLRDAGFSPVVLTRSSVVLDDLELLLSFPRAAVGFSIPTDDDRVRQIFEPGADPIDDRIDALARCAAAGLHTVAVIQPMFAMDPERLVDLVAPHVRAVRVDRMHLPPPEILRAYADHGLGETATPAWFEATGKRLVDGFRARGVVIDEMDNLVRLLDLARPR